MIFKVKNILLLRLKKNEEYLINYFFLNQIFLLNDEGKIQ